MRFFLLLSIFGLISCSHNRNPASVNGHPIAQDTMALGNVKATAVKRAEKQNVCFDVNLVMKNVGQEVAQDSNWTLAWVDKDQQYHLLSPVLRNPASAPVGKQVVESFGQYHEWTNAFTACASNARVGDVKSLVIIPKNLPYNDKKGLNLNWN